MMMIRRKRRKKTAKTKCKFRGEEFLGPQASLRVTPCLPALNHTRGEVIRPPSQIENNSYSVIRTRDLDDLSCTRCARNISICYNGGRLRLLKLVNVIPQYCIAHLLLRIKITLSCK